MSVYYAVQIGETGSTSGQCSLFYHQGLGRVSFVSGRKICRTKTIGIRDPDIPDKVEQFLLRQTEVLLARAF